MCLRQLSVTVVAQGLLSLACSDIILMREGRIVYHGPRTALPPYMAGIGFPPPLPPPAAATRASSEGGGAPAEVAGEDTADWLLSVITHPHTALLKAQAAERALKNSSSVALSQVCACT
jgi:hypothetical protein